MGQNTLLQDILRNQKLNKVLSRLITISRGSQPSHLGSHLVALSRSCQSEVFELSLDPRAKECPAPATSVACRSTLPLRVCGVVRDTEKCECRLVNPDPHP